MTGKDADAALGRANITVNKNAIPNDPRPPSIASGSAHRHSCRDDPRLQRARSGTGGRLHCRGDTRRAARRRRSSGSGRRWLNCAAVFPSTVRDGRTSGGLCTVLFAATSKPRSSIRVWRAKASRFAGGASKLSCAVSASARSKRRNLSCRSSSRRPQSRAIR